MKIEGTSTLDFVKLFASGMRDLITSSSGLDVKVAKSAMIVSGVQIMGDIGAFVAFRGDYSGIMVLNFEGEAALEIVSGYLSTLGLGPEDIPKHHTNDEVRNNIGELTNQVVGKCRVLVQEKFDLMARANIPAVVPITVPIALGMHTKDMECVRVAFTTPSQNKFYMELAMEPLKLSELRLD